MDQIGSSSELVQILHSFIDGGWLVLIVGLSGMIARLALTTGRVTLLDCAKNLTAAMFCSVLTWFVLEEIKIHFLYKAVIYAVVGLDAPEIIKGAVKLARGFAEDPQSFLVQLKKGKIYDGSKEKTRNIRRIRRNK